MGYYINKDSKGNDLPATNKVALLIADGAIRTDSSFKENLICVVDNFMFEAAAYIFSENECDEFKRINDRNKTWLIHPKAKELSC
ncbi:MAG: hypothetical protein M0R17_04380 [Candidatus Omnitrophica bacterium]|jgi:hypothetical protein|nr:hypothetical protein [Candidatus Omnitrophota bacterium]